MSKYRNTLDNEILERLENIESRLNSIEFERDEEKVFRNQVPAVVIIVGIGLLYLIWKRTFG